MFKPFLVRILALAAGLVSADVSIAKLFIAGVLPGMLLATLFAGYLVVWALLNPGRVPPANATMTLRQKLYESRHLIPVLGLIAAVLGSIYSGVAPATEAAAMGVILPTVQKAGIDLLWFGIFILLVVEMAQITPPVGFNLFVLQGMTRREIGWLPPVTLPFFFLMVAAVGLIWLFPDIVTALPQKVG